MFKVAIMVAAGLLPALQLPTSTNAIPHLLIMPVASPALATQAAPATQATQAKSFFSPKEAEMVRQAWEVNRQEGAKAAALSLNKSTAPSVVSVRATFKEQSGDLSGAMADYKRILAGKNMTEPRALALDGYKRILQLRIKNGEKNFYQALVKVLKDEWLNEAALNLLPIILADPDISANVKDFVRKQEPIMAMRLGRYQEAAQLWAGSKDRGDIQWLSQTENRRGNFVQAAQLREELAKKSSPGRKRNRELGVAFGFLTKGGQYDQALALATRHKVLQSQTDYHWRLGLAAMATIHSTAPANSAPATNSTAATNSAATINSAATGLEKAETHFKAVLSNPKFKKRHPGAKYFLARLEEIKGQKSQADILYQELSQGPFNYYHILAKGRLNSGGTTEAELSTRLAKLLDSGPNGQDHHSPGYQLWITEKGLELAEMEAATDTLVALGPEKLLPKNKKLAEKLLALLKVRDWGALATLTTTHEQSLKHIYPNNREAKALGGKLLASATAYSGNYRHSTRLFSRIPGDGTPGLKGWSHPLIYGQEVRKAHKDLSISPALLLALIRTESAFQPNIMSHSNARGLMQLLPATANKVAASLGQMNPGPLDLFNSGLNVGYGSWYLKQLIDNFGSEHLALAGYNGGPYNIKSLILAKPGMPLDVFVETLPFEETANYVKRIVESRFVYESVYLNETSWPNLTGPVVPPKPNLPTF